MVKQSVMVEPEDDAWLEAESRRLDRPKSFVIRKAIHTVRMLRAADGAESIDYVTASVPAGA